MIFQPFFIKLWCFPAFPAFTYLTFTISFITFVVNERKREIATNRTTDKGQNKLSNSSHIKNFHEKDISFQPFQAFQASHGGNPDTYVSYIHWTSHSHLSQVDTIYMYICTSRLYIHRIATTVEPHSQPHWQQLLGRTARLLQFPALPGYILENYFSEFLNMCFKMHTFFYENNLYKNIEAQNDPKNKKLRI